MARIGVGYGRKIRTMAYEMLEVSVYLEGDTATDTADGLFAQARDLVNKWVAEERERILEAEVPRGRGRVER